MLIALNVDGGERARARPPSETVGLVTLEDVFETLLGLEIVDEIDRVEDMQALARQMMDRRVERLGMKLSDDEQYEDSNSEPKS